MQKIFKAEEAVALIENGQTIATNGIGAIGFPDLIIDALDRRYQATRTPRDLTLVFAAGQAPFELRALVNQLAHEGLLKRMIAGHWDSARHLSRMATDNKIEGYNLPQGQIAQLYRAIASKKPGHLTRIGLGTFIDPRQDGGKINEAAKEDLVKLMEIDGHEYLFYKAFPIHVALIRGTTADPTGNISVEKEATPVDSFELALAAKACGGRVIVQVERLTAEGSMNTRDVYIPGRLVDAVVVNPSQKQTFIEEYNPAYTGEVRDINPIETYEKIRALSSGITAERKAEDNIIARRAALELLKGAVINVGLGIPELVSSLSAIEGVSDKFTLTVEAGPFGGTPVGGISFGAALNPTKILSQPTMFEFINGGGLDQTFVGFAQADIHGNVNVSKLGNRFIGVGGFVDITQSAKSVVFCGTFMAGEMDVTVTDGKMIIVRDGKYSKFIEQVGQISFSGDYARKMGQRVLYVTERAVFELMESGLTLIEVAPGVDLEKDILSKMAFKPLISPSLKTMDHKVFTVGELGLKAILCN
ncbi:MAG: acyl CoA:acetate/3-ketoacid CoA transferase [Dethiobacter sp.]|nr:acyl CoA:acetate/3-ketoacid CoA transferase [Dethiobacter sp.]